MAKLFRTASLKLVFDAGLVDGKATTKSKSYSNVKEGATDAQLKAVADALGGLCKHDLYEVLEIVQNEIIDGEL